MTKLLFLGPVLLYCALNSVTVRVFKKRFGYAMPFTMAASVLLMYLSQLLCKSWQPGFILLLLLALAVLV